MERQKSGFNFQDDFISKNNLIPEESYTAEWDAYTQDNTPIQIKTYKLGGELCLGDLKRNLNKDKDFYLVCGAYNNAGLFVDISIYFVKKEVWASLFNCSEQIVNEMFDFLHNITNNYNDDEKWKQGINYFKSLTVGIAVPRFKRDHKTQKRIQAAVPKRNLQVFFESFKKIENFS